MTIRHYTFTASALLISMFVLTSCCYGSDFVFIRSNNDTSAEQEKLQVAVNFYGLTLKVVTATSSADNLSIRTAVQQKETVGVAIDSAALSSISEDALLRALNHEAGNYIPLFILAIRPDLSPTLLKGWSGREATRCRRLENSSDSQYTFGRIGGVTWQLAGLDAPFPTKNSSTFALDDIGTAHAIEIVRDHNNAFPVFIESSIGRQTVFLACITSEGSNVYDDRDVVSVFLKIAPEMIFVRFCAGERGWHSPHYYANFTIDDPWLREPYGYVDYEGLLQEMEKHQFHTTIAFIPWNYDRSQAEVVSLFRNHPDRFSITVHGNNHDHKEFTNYGSKPLAVQIGDLKQALTRMEGFQASTGIPYDKVMIFPHSIAPEQTLEALKTYNYLATINSSNVPQGIVMAASPSEVLRPVTLSFKGFPSISRYSTQVPVTEAYVAINQFLGNPLFFYDHSDFFSKGIDAFDHVADAVNRLEPATEWRSLGEIVKHLYVVKLRDDSDYDVLAFSNNICLENTTGRGSTFYVQKKEIGGQTIDSVTVDGGIQPYTLQEDQISFAVSVPLGGKRCISIQYANDFRSSSIDPRHDSAVVYLLRMGSDFRDIYLAKSGVGLAIIRFYNKHELMPAKVLACLLLLLIAMIYAAFRLWMSKREPSIKSGPSRHLMN
jgi:hypothetical protein